MAQLEGKIAVVTGGTQGLGAAIARADAGFGRIDALVNAAAVTDRGTIIDTSPGLFDAILAVNVCSVSGMAGQPFIAARCASKGALATLTRGGRS